MVKISRIIGRQILDSRGSPTVEVDVFLEDDSFGRFAVPSGASTGEHEAHELRDGDSNCFGGKGVRKAVEHVNTTLSKLLIGVPAGNQQLIDDKMKEADGTTNKSKLGANSLLGVSFAVFKAYCDHLNKEPFEVFAGDNDSSYLPVPLMNLINGGAHANNCLDFQEFMIVPYGAASFSECLRFGSEIFQCLKQKLAKNSMSTAVGDEGGFAPDFKKNEEALQFLLESIVEAGYKPLDEVGIALDVAASEFYNASTGKYEVEGLPRKTSEEMVSWYESLSRSFPIVSIEDGLDENDWKGWRHLTEKLGSKLQLVGDDLFVTNPTLIQKGIDTKTANAVLVKPNQIGTVTETLAAINLGLENKYSTVISHRSGETEDVTIADLAVGTSSSQIKTGSLSRSERVAKYNRLLRIEEKLGKKAVFFGKKAFSKWLR